MKTPIEVKDIRKGDLIRCEYPNTGTTVATEYIAPRDAYVWDQEYPHYLLERPEPPFEPYWGMVIGSPRVVEDRAVYIPENTKKSHLGWMIYGSKNYQGNDWAKQKLAEGWVVIEKPEGVK